METKVRVGPQLARVDIEETAALYRNAETTAGADECTCASCRNFAAQRADVYPEHFIGLLHQLGVDPAKELEAFDYDSDDVAGAHLYGGWFLLRGEIAEGAEWRPNIEPGSFTYWFTDSFPSGALPSERNYCAVEFCTTVPWVVADAGTPNHEPKTEV